MTKLQNGLRFRWMLSIHISFTVGARAPKHPWNRRLCVYIHVVAMSNSCRNVALRGCARLRGSISYFFATRSLLMNVEAADYHFGQTKFADFPTDSHIHSNRHVGRDAAGNTTDRRSRSSTVIVRKLTDIHVVTKRRMWPIKRIKLTVPKNRKMPKIICKNIFLIVD